MTISSAVQTIIWTVLFVVPGYVAVMIKHYWLSTLGRPGERVLESIAWSITLYLFANWLPDRVFNLGEFQSLVSANMNSPEKALFSADFLLAYGFLLALGIGLAILYFKIFSLVLWPALFGRSPHARVWDEFWSLNKKKGATQGVWIETKDNSTWAGYLKRASDSPGEREIWLTDVKKYKNEQLFDTPTTDLLLNATDIHRIFILQDGLNEESANDIASTGKEHPNSEVAPSK